MRASQKNAADYSKQHDVDNTDDPKGKHSIRSEQPRRRTGQHDDPNPNDGKGQPVGGAYPESRLAKGDARISMVNKSGAEAAGADGMTKNSDF